MPARIRFLDMFAEVAQLIVAKYAVPGGVPQEYKDEMDTWQCWPIRGYPSLRLVITLANPDLPLRDQFGCIGIVEEGFEEELTNTTLRLISSVRLFLLRVITLGDNCPSIRGRDIRVDCPIRDYGPDYIGTDAPLEVIGGILEMLSALKASDRSR